MAASAGGSQMMMILLLVGAAGIGVYLYTQNKKKQQVVQQAELDQQVAASHQTTIQGLSPQLDFNLAQTGPNRTGAVTIPSDLVQGIIPDNFNKPGVPIISGSTSDIDDPTKYKKTAAGLCQCNDQKCCYWAPYYARNGLKTSVSKNERCSNIRYGNAVQACDAAFADFESDATSHYAQAVAYRSKAQYYASRPRTAYHATRLYSARMARMYS